MKQPKVKVNGLSDRKSDTMPIGPHGRQPKHEYEVILTSLIAKTETPMGLLGYKWSWRPTSVTMKP